MILAWGSRGDLQPITALSLRLKQAGRDILVFATPPSTNLLQTNGIDCVVAKENVAEFVENMDWALDAALNQLGKSRAELENEVAAHFDHRKKLECYRGPLLVLHANDDTLVDRSHAERLHQWSASDEKKLVLFQKGDHNSIFFENKTAYLHELGEFLGRANF